MTGPVYGPVKDDVAIGAPAACTDNRGHNHGVATRGDARPATHPERHLARDLDFAGRPERHALIRRTEHGDGTSLAEGQIRIAQRGRQLRLRSGPSLHGGNEEHQHEHLHSLTDALGLT